MTIFAWLAAGGVLLFAVNVHPEHVNLRLAGLILLARGAAGLWRSLTKQQRARCMHRAVSTAARGAHALDALCADLSRDDSTRVPLADLIGRPGGPGRGRPVAAGLKGQRTDE